MKKLREVTLLEELSNQLQKMEEVGKVDISVIDTIDKIVNSCHLMENFWRDNEKVSIQDAFLLYHASRNARIIFQKMRERFIEAEKKHQNPSIVHDSSAVLPSLSEVCATVSELTTQTLTKDLVSMVSEKVEYLRDNAFANSLLPTPEEEMKELDEKRLRKRFSQFAETLQAMYI